MSSTAHRTLLRFASWVECGSGITGCKDWLCADILRRPFEATDACVEMILSDGVDRERQPTAPPGKTVHRAERQAG